jgi:amino acid transporter
LQTEETKNADRSGPIGIITAVALSSIFGWIYLVALTSVVIDIPYLLSPDNDAGGNAIAQALYSTFRLRFGSGAGAVACLVVIAVAMFLCGLASITSNSRFVTELIITSYILCPSTIISLKMRHPSTLMA